MYRSTKGASKARRDQINAEIRNLKDLLPISDGDKVRLSYLHIMSLACMYTRKSIFFARGSPLQELEDLLSPQDMSEFVQTLPGFLLAFTSEGKLIYVSENVAEHLGHSMVDLVAQGDCIYDVIDPADHFVMRSQLAAPSPTDTGDRMFRCHFNTSKTVRRQSAGNKLVLIKGRFHQPPAGSYWSSNPVFTAFCIPLDPKPRVTHNTFFMAFFESKHAKDMSILDVSDSVMLHLGFEKRELVCKSWYNLMHPEDLSHASAQHCRLVGDKNDPRAEVVIRLQRKDQGWVWIYCLIQQESAEIPFTCYNYIISEPEAWCLRQQLTSEETQLTYVFIATAPFQESLLSPGHLSSPDQVFTPISSASTSGVSMQSFDFSGVCSVEGPQEYPSGASLGQEDITLGQMAMDQGDISSMEEATGSSARPPTKDQDFCYTECLFLPSTTYEQTFRREAPSTSSKDFVCTPPYTPHQGCAFMFSSQESYPKTTATTTTTPTPTTTTTTTPELYYSTEESSALYEKLPPTPSPGDGDCIVMTVPEVRGPLYIDVPMVPDGILTPEASPIKQTLFRYSEKEKTEIDLLAKQISTLAEDFNSFATKDLPFPEPTYARHTNVSRSSSLPSSLPSSCNDFLPLRHWRSIDFSFLACPEEDFLEENTIENIFRDLSPPLFERSGSGARCPHQLCGNVSSPFCLDVEARSEAEMLLSPSQPMDLSPEEQSFLEELASYETAFETRASRSPCDGFNDELYQLPNQPQDNFHEDESGGDPSF
ncbi:neuronal PAS domain-containing protein 4 isoform X2 [Ambystoma mexicanum]|uniref:neuronal PAS domain-containing protein 4 isoform X2 n=1 Tax=Ambystoma mexicanum TaxID=8296 RepID=UPI0037E7C0E3